MNVYYNPLLLLFQIKFQQNISYGILTSWNMIDWFTLQGYVKLFFYVRYTTIKT